MLQTPYRILTSRRPHPRDSSGLYGLVMAGYFTQHALLLTPSKPLKNSFKYSKIISAQES